MEKYLGLNFENIELTLHPKTREKSHYSAQLHQLRNVLRYYNRLQQIGTDFQAFCKAFDFDYEEVLADIEIYETIGPQLMHILEDKQVSITVIHQIARMPEERINAIRDQLFSVLSEDEGKEEALQDIIKEARVQLLQQETSHGKYEE